MPPSFSITSDLLGIFAADANGVELARHRDANRDGILPHRDQIHTTDCSAISSNSGPTLDHLNQRASGVISGVTSVYTEDYDNLVDGSGTVATPYGEFPALRIKTEFTQTVGFLVTAARLVLLLECFGSIASMVSKDNPAAGELTTVSELRRLIP